MKKKSQVKYPMLKIVFNEGKTSSLGRSSALGQLRTEGTEVVDQIRVNLISEDVTEAGRTVPGERREEHD